jgi:hypothetical protein
MVASQTNDKTCPKRVNAKLIWLKKLKAKAVELLMEKEGRKRATGKAPQYPLKKKAA